MSDYRLYWRFRLEWEQVGAAGVPVDRVDVATFDTATEALRAHATACEGRWVQPGYTRPVVSRLEQCRIDLTRSTGAPGRVEVTDVLRPGVDCQPVAAVQDPLRQAAR